MSDPPRRARLRAVLRTVTDAAIAAADPHQAVRDAVRVSARGVRICGDQLPADAATWHVLAMGKAAPTMAAALVELRPSAVAGGIILTKHGHGRAVPPLVTYEAGHPVPDRGSVRGAHALLRYAHERVAPGDLVWVAVSGGGSAVCCAPADGVTLADKRRTTDLLLRAGAEIREMNAVRKHLSALKGGRLARALAGATVVTLAVSDVMGDDPATIASGPTAPDPTTYADAVDVLRRYDVWRRAPARVREHLEAGAAGRHPETPKPRDPVFRRQRYHVIANNDCAVRAAAREAQRCGFAPLVLSTTFGGETREVAAAHAAIAREVCTHGRPRRPPVALISGGETVVTLGRASGRGGRNQEFTLAFLAALGAVGRPVAVASVGTDGTDGPTDAAGAVGDDRTLARAGAAGLPPATDALARHDSYPWFAALEDLVVTGPTGTNVMDLHVILVA